MSSEIRESDLNSIGSLVVEHAYSLFSELGCVDDFCVQHAGATAVVFGGHNRIVWTVKNGFRIERSYCYESVVEAWDKLFSETNLD